MVLSHNHRRNGKVIILLLLSLPMLLAMAAFTIDMGTLFLTKTELQRATDSAALAAVLELVPDPDPIFPLESPVKLSIGFPDVLQAELDYDFTTTLDVNGNDVEVIVPTGYPDQGPAHDLAKEYFARNPLNYVGRVSLHDSNIEIMNWGEPVPCPGVLSLVPALGTLTREVERILLSPPGANLPNAIAVDVACGDEDNQAVSLHIAPVFGTDAANVRAPSTAAIYPAYGVRPGAKVLPFAMDITVWRALRIGNGTVNGIPIAEALLGSGGRPVVLVDEQIWDQETQTVSSGSDKLWEVLLLDRPLHEIELDGLQTELNTLANGLGLLNAFDLFGGLDKKLLNTPATIAAIDFSDSGLPNSGTLNRQIVEGLSEDDLPGDRKYLPFTADGDEGIPPDTFDSLASIVGKPRILPLFETVPGTAINKAKGLLGMGEKYRIIGFAGVVVTEVGDLGAVRYVKFQPTTVISQYLLKAQRQQRASFSDAVYTCPVLVKNPDE